MALVWASTVSPGTRLNAQNLTLAEAFERADQSAYSNRMAEGEIQARSGDKTSALAGILPTLRAEGGYAKTTDPLGAFGTVLRQRAVTPAAFDPAALNHPATQSSYAGGLVVEQPLFNADAWLGRAAASSATAATVAHGRWTWETVRADVVRAYFGAILAGFRVKTLEAASRAAHEHARQAELMVANGMVTRSDALLASVRAGEVDAELATARGARANARRELALLLGAPAIATVALAERLPSPTRIRSVIEPGSLVEGERSDLAAARHAWDAARRDVWRARSRYLPRFNSFARYDWYAANGIFAGEASWTIGVMAVWTPFAGASEIGDMQAAKGREATARARAEAAEHRAMVEMARHQTEVEVALARLAIAERAVEQSRDAHRIVSRKYEGGLATVVELLDAQATETSTELGLSHAQYQVIVAEADRRKAHGLSIASLIALEE
ncbi:MAG: TolC family protein [Gemmatimonadales bacterium]|nr:TolC family protein [Gemmatimonadales bacterium]